MVRVMPPHTLERQSLADVHDIPVPHPGQVLPPQSVAVSSPLRTPSSHVGAAHVPASHTPDAHTLASLHVTPGPHNGHEPPQSTPPSDQFLTPSVHVGAEHVPAASSHTPESQLEGSVQVEPAAQPVQVGPVEGEVPSQWDAVVPQYPNGLQHMPAGHTALFGELWPHLYSGATATSRTPAPQSASGRQQTVSVAMGGSHGHPGRLVLQRT